MIEKYSASDDLRRFAKISLLVRNKHSKKADLLQRRRERDHKFFSGNWEELIENLCKTVRV